MTESAKPPNPPSGPGPLPSDEEAIRVAVAALAARLAPEGPPKAPPPAISAPAARDEQATVIPGKAAAPLPAEAPKTVRSTRAAVLLPPTISMGPPTVPRSRRGAGGLVFAAIGLLLVLGGGAWLLRDHPQVASLLGRDGVPTAEPKQATVAPQPATPKPPPASVPSAPPASPPAASPKPDAPPPATAPTAPPAAAPDPAPPAATTPEPAPPAPAPTQAAPAAPAEPAKPDTPPPATTAEPPRAAVPSPPQAATPKADPAAAPPTFDNVFVRDGRAVISGRAPVGARVEVRLGDRTMATVEADDRGEWVAILDTPLPPGGHEFRLIQTPPGGMPVASDRTVAVVIPAPAESPPQAAAPPASPAPTPPPAETAKPDTVPQASPPPAVAPAPPAAAPSATTPAPAVVTPAPPAAAPASPVATPAAPAAPLVVATPTTPGGASQVLQSPPLARAGDLVLGAVDYDDIGRMTISGRATPGETVRVYLNNQRLGDGTAGADGKWILEPGRATPHGPQRLRVDRLASGGAGGVAYRLEVPFERVKVKPGDSVTIVRGDNLWNIARGALGSGERFTAIYEANRNQIRNPDLIYPGQVFVIPKPQ